MKRTMLISTQTIAFLLGFAVVPTCTAPVQAVEVEEAPAPLARDPEALRELTWVGGQALPLAGPTLAMNLH